jgi:SAM-dependent methyltransferase
MSGKDAFGEGLLAYQKNGRGLEIIERDDGLIDAIESPRTYFAPFSDWKGLDKRVLAMAKGRVLDVGCGAGRFCLEAQKGGLEVLGIDLSPLALRICRERGVKKTRLLDLESVGRLEPATFETVVMMGNNLGLLGSRAKARRILKALFRVTTTSARIYGTTLDPYQTRDPLHLAYHRRNRARGRMGGQIRIRVRYRVHKGPWFDYLFLSERELQALVRGTGWKLEKKLAGDGPNWVAVLAKAR